MAEIMVIVMRTPLVVSDWLFIICILAFLYFRHTLDVLYSRGFTIYAKLLAR